jgi:hypothetical protein
MGEIKPEAGEASCHFGAHLLALEATVGTWPDNSEDLPPTVWECLRVSFKPVALQSTIEDFLGCTSQLVEGEKEKNRA